MLKLLKYLKVREWLFMGISLIFIVTQVWLDLKLPEYMSTITRLVQTGGSQISDIAGSGGKMLLCALGSFAAACIVGYFAARISSGLSATLREKLFDKVQSFSMYEINEFSIASLITRSTNDVTQVQQIVAMGLQVLIKAPITAVWAIMKIMGKTWQWTAATAGAVGILLVILVIIFILVIPKSNRIQELTDMLNNVTRENLTGLRVVRAYNAEAYQHQKFNTVNYDLAKTNLFLNRTMALLMPSMALLSSGLSLGIYWIGGYIINTAGMTERLVIFSDMVVFSSYAMQILSAFIFVVMLIIMLPVALVSARRINEVLDKKLSIKEGCKGIDDTVAAGSIEFRDVSFKYPGAADYVLENISFKAAPGETVAIIGSTGSGKSTLINLIPRFYDSTQGQVLVDGVDVREYRANELNNRLGYVSQKAVLFSGTVAANVAYGDNHGRRPAVEDIEEALEIARAGEFVSRMEGGIEAVIAQNGANVSGGQRQRLSIARAICRKPPVYIFDDSFSALDYKTDRELRRGLRQKVQKATKLIVALRIGTIIDADKIIVLDQGRIAGQGRHRELLKTCKVYQEIAKSQLSLEELNNG